MANAPQRCLPFSWSCISSGYSFHSSMVVCGNATKGDLTGRLSFREINSTLPTFTT